ncbi:MAG: NAD-dependent epimerase/dehydratase family protein, partial [Myxococcales bacterium]
HTTSPLALPTGATGLVGNAVARQLVSRGRPVRALVRSPTRAAALVPPEVELVEGDVTDTTSVRSALEGCTRVFHCAGLPEQWLPDPRRFDEVNAGGTRNLCDAAVEAGVERFVYTSTIDVFAAAPFETYDESRLDPAPKGTAYERSKQRADRIVVEAMGRGLPAVFLHPAAVYGPGPETSPGINDFAVRLLTGKIPLLLPGATPLVHASDCADAHLRAEEQADVGARYILAETTLTLRQIAQMIVVEAGSGRVPPVLPLPIARAVSEAGELLAKLVRRPPLIPRGQLHFLQWQARPSSARAQQELGWRPRPFEAGLRETLASLRQVGRLTDGRTSEVRRR